MADALPRLKAALAGRYTIERELGRGGMATVYLAQDRKHGRQVAIKVLKPELAAAIGPERFLREIEIGARLTHPLILPLHDSGEAGDFLYYVMPLVDGESLRGRLDREPQLPLEEALQITREVADALSYAHSHDVVHRDIKPENILFQAGHAIVSDFGIARAITAAAGEKLTETGIAIGTPKYMSPEQATGRERLDGRSDIYSLACVLYEMLAGHPPFFGATAQEQVARHTLDPVPPLRTVRPGVPDAVEQAIGKALAKVAADRFATAAQFAYALSPPLVGAEPAPVDRSRVRRALSLGLAGLALLLVGGLLWRTLSGGRSSSATTTAAPTSVAVLYFDNLSHDSTDAYLADGLTDEIIARLGQIERLKIKSRTAVRHYRGTGPDVATLSRALGVAYLVNGTVRRGAGRLRVTVELLGTATGDRVWGQQYDRAEADLLELQEDIARAVATGIAGRLLPAERATLAARPTRSPEAYDHFLRGNRLLWREVESSVLGAIAEYEAALRLDSAFTAARGRLAYAYGLALNWAYQPAALPAESVLARGAAAAEEALREDSTVADAWLGRALVLFFGGRPEDWVAVIESSQRAMKLNPGDDGTHQWYGTLLRRLGRFEEAEQEYHRALVINPELVQGVADLAFLAYSRRQFAEARQWYDSAVALDTTFSNTYQFRARVRLELNDITGALEDATTALRLSRASERVRATAVLATIEARRGEQTRAREHLQTVFEQLGWSNGVPPSAISVRNAYDVALAAVAAGEPEVALAILEQARPRGPWLWSYLILPGFDAIRTDPRFHRIYEESRPPGVK